MRKPAREVQVGEHIFVGGESDMACHFKVKSLTRFIEHIAIRSYGRDETSGARGICLFIEPNQEVEVR